MTKCDYRAQPNQPLRVNLGSKMTLNFATCSKQFLDFPIPFFNATSSITWTISWAIPPPDSTQFKKLENWLHDALIHGDPQKIPPQFIAAWVLQAKIIQPKIKIQEEYPQVNTRTTKPQVKKQKSHRKPQASHTIPKRERKRLCVKI